MGKDRLERVDSLLRRVIAEGVFRIMQGSGVPPASITITGVECGKDLRDATVRVSVFGEESLKRRAIRELSRNARKFQQEINAQVKLKFTPRLAFRLDRSIEQGDRVLSILEKLEI